MSRAEDPQREHGRRARPGADGRLRPVVRVEITTDGDHRTLLEYGPDDELLRSSYQRSS